jgi:hypothetical protein
MVGVKRRQVNESGVVDSLTRDACLQVRFRLLGICKELQRTPLEQSSNFFTAFAGSNRGEAKLLIAARSSLCSGRPTTLFQAEPPAP